MYRFWHFGLKLPIDTSFWGVFWAYFSHMNDVTHCPDPQKDIPWAEKRRLSHSAYESVRRFDLGSLPRKKNTGQQKVTKVLYFPYLGASPHWTDSIQKLHGG